MPVRRPAALVVLLASGCVTAAATATASRGAVGGAAPFAVSPQHTTVRAQGQLLFSATGAPVTWSVAEGPTGGVISSGGIYTAPATAGMFHVVATEPLSGRSAAAVVTVTASPPGTVEGLAIPEGHPRLWFDAARLATARAWYRSTGFTPEPDDHVGQALKGLLANDPASCRSAIAWALTSASDGTFPVPGGATCDACRWSGEEAILTYDWCHAFLTADEAATLREATTAWVDHWRQQPWGGPQTPENEYFLAYLRNELEWGIAAYGDDPAAPALLRFAFGDRLAGAFDASARSGTQRGGAVRLGSTLGRAHYGAATIPWVTAALLGRNLYDELGPYWREVVYALIYATQPGRTTGGAGQATDLGFTLWPFNDGDRWPSPSAASPGLEHADFMTTAAMRWSTLPVGRHARQWLQLTGAPRSEHVQAVDPGGPPLAFGDLPLDYHAAGAGYVYARSGWDADATTLFLKLGAGPALGHAHADWGSWQLWRKGRYLSRETTGFEEDIAGPAGAGSTPVALHLAHNSLLVDGRGNRSAPQGTEGARVTRLDSQPGYTFAAVELTGTGDDPAFVSWVREFVFFRGLATLVILDRVQSASPGATRTFLSHCETLPTLGAGTATCTIGSQAFVQTTLPPTDAVYGIVNEGGEVGQFRIEADTTPATAQTHLVTVLQAKDAGAPALAPRLSWSADGASFTVALDGSNDVTFSAGMASAGGAITVGGHAAPLRADVRALSVTDAGPAWR